MTATDADPAPDLLPVPQEHALGCAVACVAARCRVPYREALALFQPRESAWLCGYYCGQVVDALARAGLRYAFEPFHPDRHAGALDTPGTIIFVDPCDAYPAGHYLVRARDGWLNSWSNYPQMVSVEAACQPSAPGKIGWIVFELPELGPPAGEPGH